MKEIGGYFGLEQFSGRELYPDAIALNTGRNALLYLIKARKIKKLYLPYYLCDCCSDVCDRNGCEYEYYHIGSDFLPVFEKTLSEGEYLYIVNYFGRLGTEKAKELKEKYGNIIFDNVQAFFQPPVSGMDTIYSCRKFLGVPDGAYLYTDAVIDEEVETDRSAGRMKHVLGRFEESASAYYADFQESDESLYGYPLRYMSPLTHNLLRAIDYESVSRARKGNYRLLQLELGNMNKIDANAPEGPYCYPFYCENGAEVKRALAGKKIFIPTLWPNVPETEGANELEKDFTFNILPIPCDQRYDASDMEYIVENIKNLL